MHFKQWNFITLSLHTPSSFLITQCWFVHFFLFRTLLRTYISCKVESSFVEDIKMAASFSGVRQYVGWVIFVHNVISKMRFEVLLRWRGCVHEKCHTEVFRSKMDLPAVSYHFFYCFFSKYSNLPLITIWFFL